MRCKRIFACMISIVMTMGMCSCKSDGKTEEYSEIMKAEDVIISTGTDVPESEEMKDKTSEITTTSAVSSTSITTTSKTTVVTSKTKKTSTTSVKPVSIVKNNSNNNSNNSVSGGSSNKKTTTKPVTTTATKITTTTTTTVYIAPEDVDKYIDFGTVSSGDGYTFDGSTLNIFEPGTYHLSGTLVGMIYINVSNDDKVKLRLNGVGIENTGAPCIQVDNADRVTVNAVSGSSNSLMCYGTNARADAAIFSKDDLKIKGNGSLYVFCDNEHGISCNNDLEIEECQLTVDAEKTGINSHKSIMIYSGSIDTNGDNCGIRCRDYIEIIDGYVSSCGGKKTGADRGGIISDTGNFFITGGTVIAVGMNQTIPNGQVSAVFSFPSTMTKDNVVGISVAGASIASAVPNKKFTCALISDPSLYIGAVCDVWLSDAFYDNFTLTDTVTVLSLDGVE